jgi:glycerol-3-phosphate dehydrogenase
MEKYDVIVIGGGLLGCFTARGLTRTTLKTAVLEAREDVCTGVSRANTAIVYSGCDTKPGTLKSRMCVRAAQTFGDLCRDLGVRYSPCGSLMVCFGPFGEETLRKKMAQGLENGVRGLRLLTREEVLVLEPELSPAVRQGLWAPEAGTVIPWELGLAAAENAVSNGAEFIFNTSVTGIDRTGDGYKVTAGGAVFFSRGIVNCAGLHADEILELAAPPSVRIFPAAGDYLVLDTKARGAVSHVIFHEPEEKGKGLTLVPTVDGNILIGPSRAPFDGSEDFRTSRGGLDTLKALIAEVIPSLPTAHVIRSFGALRPNPFWVRRDTESGTYVREEKGISTFTIIENDANPAFLSLVGIKTPGMTCANELGLHVSDRMATLLDAAANPDYTPCRPSPLRLSDLPNDACATLVRDNPAYGRIVCRCRKISEGEIIDSIHKNPGAVTVDGVKRRTGATSGRCQGSFCTQRIIELLARELGVRPNEVLKDGPGSQVIGGERNGQKIDGI